MRQFAKITFKDLPANAGPREHQNGKTAIPTIMRYGKVKRVIVNMPFVR